MTSDLPPGWWGEPTTSPRPRSITEQIRVGVLDAELAALVWLLLEAHVPLIVAAGPTGAGRSTLLAALLDFLPARTVRRPVLGRGEDFAWLPGPDAEQLGLEPRPGEAGEAGGGAADATILLVPELSDHCPWYTWGDRARLVIRALSLGYGLAATIHAESLEEVFEALGAPPVAATSDELSHLGVVLILRAVEPAEADGHDSPPRRRVIAAHYVRPLSRDAHGHVQRLGPAVLATWDEQVDTFEHFAWGVVPELALRARRRAGDFEAEQRRRADYLGTIVAAGVVEPEAVREAIERYRRSV